MKHAIFALVAMTFTQSALACLVTSAKIEGRISGSETTKGVCLVSVDLEKVSPHAHCPLPLAKGQTIVIATSLKGRSCPQDEGPVNGVVSSGGVGKAYRFVGTVDGKITK